MTFFDSLKKWFYTKNSSAASSDARVPLLDASGNPKGSDTMANLASVLGAKEFKTYNDVSLNSLPHNEVCLCLVTLSNQDDYATYNFPIRTNGCFVWLATKGSNLSDERGIQYCIAQGSAELFFRYSWSGYGDSSSWKTIAYNIPTFYKDYSTLESLASALGALCQHSVIDSGDVNSLYSGIYGVNGQLTNAPSGTGASMLIVMNAGWMRCDVLFDRSNPRFFYRFKWGSAGFEEWKAIS